MPTLNNNLPAVKQVPQLVGVPLCDIPFKPTDDTMHKNGERTQEADDLHTKLDKLIGSNGTLSIPYVFDTLEQQGIK
jgi:hypothetical protein